MPRTEINGDMITHPERTVASAATTNIGAASSDRVLISGTTTITSFGTSPNKIKFVTFLAALVLTHNATSLILPGGANITTAAGDSAIFVSNASGNWRCVDYQRANGTSIAGVDYSTTTVASAATADIGAAPTDRVNVTGTTTITSLGTSANRLKHVTFAGALTLTHNATTLILPTGANIVTAAGDYGVFSSDASGNWTCLAYYRRTGRALFANTAYLDTAQVWTATQLAQAFALTSATAWDGTVRQSLTANVNGATFTIANPSAANAGAYYTVFVTYTTSNSIAWGSVFRGISAITPTATAGAADHFVFRFDGTNMHCVGFALNTGA